MKKKEALIIIDMINDFVHPKGILYVKGSEKIIPFIKKKIKEFRNEKFPIIYAVDSHLESDKEFSLFPKHAVRGTWGAKIVEELAPSKEDIVFTKRKYPAFFETGLDVYLREMDVKDITIVGVVTHICVFYTAIFGSLLGYNVTVLRKGIYDFDENLHNISLSELEKTWGVKVV